jgi:hypothetical protein
MNSAVLNGRYLWDFVQRGLLAVSHSKLISGIWLMLASAFNVLTATGGEVEAVNPRDITPDFAILDALEKYLRRFILLPDESLYSLVSLWVIGTHLHKEFDFFGYLFLHSPEAQSGKSRLLELLNEVAFNPSGIVISPTPATLFRAADNKTFLLDEVDAWTRKDDLKEVLNGGFQKGRTVVRCDGKETGFTPRNFNVYAPRALAGIGTDILEPVTRDRTFMIRMVRQKQTERRERFQPRKIKPELDALRKGIGDWVKRNKQAVREWYEKGDAPYLQSFHDRTIDVSNSLAAILEVAYRQSEGIRETRERFAKAVGMTRGEQQSTESGHEILRELTRLAQAQNPLVGSASELAERLHSVIDGGIGEYDVSGVLRRYDFKTKSTRLRGEEQPRYRYSLPYAALQDLCERYAGVEMEAQEQAAAPERVM